MGGLAQGRAAARATANACCTATTERCTRGRDSSRASRTVRSSSTTANGDVAREGTYVAGRLDGTVTAYASERSRAANGFAPCCVPPGAARLCERYRAGDFLVEVFYDREGRAILSDGRLCPVAARRAARAGCSSTSRASGWTLRSRGLNRFWTRARHADRGDRDPRTRRRAASSASSTPTGRLQQEAGFTADESAERARSTGVSPTGAVPYADPRDPPGARRLRGRTDHRDAGRSSTRTARSCARSIAGSRCATATSAKPAGRRWPMRAAIGWRTRARSRRKGACARRSWRRRARARGDAAIARAVRSPARRARRARSTPEREAQWGEALSQSTDATSRRSWTR